MGDDYEARLVELEKVMIKLFEQLSVQGKVILKNREELKEARKVFVQVHDLLRMLMQDYNDRGDEIMNKMFEAIKTLQKYPM